MAQSVEHIVHIDGVTGSSPVATTISKSGKQLAGLFLFPCFFIVHTDGGSKPPPAVRDSGGFERFESCFVRHVQSGKLLVGLFLFLSASSFAPMEVQSRRPLCGIQANLNGSSPVLSAISSPASCLPGFFFFPRFFIVHTDGGSKSPPAVRDSGGFERFESCCDHQHGKVLVNQGLFFFVLSPAEGAAFPRRQGAILDVNKMNAQPVHASRCER